MKKSFTLKAFAFGAAATVALAATATPHEFLKAQTEPVAVKSNVKQDALSGVHTSVKQLNSMSSHKAPAQKAEANYGEWSAAAPGTYSFVQMSSSKKDYDYQKSEDSANPGNFKVKISNWGAGVISGTGTELEFTVTKTTFALEDETRETIAPTLPSGGVFTGVQAGGYPDGKKHDVYVFDRVNWMRALRAAGETWDDGSAITDEQCEQWFLLYGYNDATGLLTYYPIYTLVVDGKPTWYTFPSTSGSGSSIQYLTESYQMTGGDYKNYNLDLNTTEGYFSHEKDATTGTFNVKYNMHDNNEAWFQILVGKKTGKALEDAQQELMEIAYNGTSAAGVIKVTATSGEVQIPITNYRQGQYTLLCVARYPGIEDGYFITKTDNTLRMLADDVEYYSAGSASYTDATMYDALPGVFGMQNYESLQAAFKSQLQIELPDVYTTTVPMQASSTTPGQYRLVRPFLEYYNSFLSTQLEYDILSDYLLFNISDPEKCYILPSATGIYFPTENSGEIMMVYGSSNKMEGGSAASANAWGSISNGAIVFPELVIPQGVTTINEAISAISWSQASFNSNTGTITYKDWAVNTFYPEICKIEAGEFAGIENVAADAEFDVNAPVEYFNLQGIRVATPEAGQLLIKRQGNKATKVVIR